LVVGDPLVRQTVRFGRETWYADAGWLNEEAHLILEHFCGRSTAPSDSICVFFRDPSGKVLERWSSSLLGAFWAWARRLTAGSERTAADSEIFVLDRLIRFVLEVDGIMVLLADIESAGRVLVLVGRESTCKEITRQLGVQADIDWLASLDDIGRPQWVAWMT
jgi:hypothetical protein